MLLLLGWRCQIAFSPQVSMSKTECGLNNNAGEIPAQGWHVPETMVELLRTGAWGPVGWGRWVCHAGRASVPV